METEREKFRAYIENSGLMSALTNVLVTLYEEPDKPPNALNYVITSLSCGAMEDKQLEILEKKCNDLEAENKMLKERVWELSNKCNEPQDSNSLPSSRGSDYAKEETQPR